MKTSQWRRAVENRCVFSARLKALSDRSGDRSAGGRRFRVADPLTAKQVAETSLSSCSGRCPGTAHPKENAVCSSFSPLAR